MKSASLTEIERIVREVLAELGVAPMGSAAPAVDRDSAKTPPAAAPLPAPDEVVVNSQVVTMEDVAGRLAAARRLVVPPRAVVTPAVRDELRRRNVTLVRATASPSRRAAVSRLVLVAARTKRDPVTLVRALGQEGVQVEQHAADCLIAATDRLAGELVKPDTLGLLWTRHTASGLCLANRHPGVRAVLGTDVPATGSAVEAVGANLLVLDPVVGTAFQQRQILSEFCRGGVRQCPETLKQRLG